MKWFKNRNNLILLLIIYAILLVPIYYSFNERAQNKITDYLYLVGALIGIVGLFWLIYKIKFTKRNDIQRKYSVVQINEIEKKITYKNEFYYSKWMFWGSVIMILLLLIPSLFLLDVIKMYYFIIYFFILIIFSFVINFNFKSIKYKDAVFKIANEGIWIKDIGLILNDEISRIKLDNSYRSMYTLQTWYFLNVYLEVGDDSVQFVHFYLNDIKNYKEIINILNPEIENYYPD